MNRTIGNAIFDGDIDWVDEYAKQGHNINEVDKEAMIEVTPLFDAVMYKRTKIVKLLLDYDANMYIKNTLDDTAFHLAAKKGYFDMVKLFCEHEIDIDIKGQEDLTALNYAVWLDYDDIAEYLIKKGASLDIPDITNMTPRSQMEEKGKKYF